ncbi:MAG: Fe-S cluster protein [Candidatus Pacebacteria bacterium CG10_big_fil_rev_8_21_14_0_10_56_10]|nr:MAG: Fe-S cluster protein [Candidatus Pacebacteria bacterium CG10_big_fil_rev_8_21_14_0_10_56_10]
MSLDLYQQNILEELRRPRHKGVLEPADYVVDRLNLSCGDGIKVYLKTDPNTKTIVELAWQGEGCAISQAAMSLLSDEVIGRTLAELDRFGQVELEQLLGLEDITPGRVPCLMLGLEALQSIEV